MYKLQTSINWRLTVGAYAVQRMATPPFNKVLANIVHVDIWCWHLLTVQEARESWHTTPICPTAQPSYRHNLISLQPPRSTRSCICCHSVTHSLPPTSSSLKITVRSRDHLDMQSMQCITSTLESTSRFIPSDSPFLSRFTSSSSYQKMSWDSQLISVIIPTLVIHHTFTLSLQAQPLKTYFFNKSILPTVDFFYVLDCLTITGLDWTYHAHHYGRPLSVSGRPCYILPIFLFIYFFMAALFSGPG